MRTIITSLIFLLLLTGCKDSNREKDAAKNDFLVKNNLEVSFKKILELNENINQLGEIISFDFVDDNHFVVATRSGEIFGYDFEGNQINEIKKQGNGPGEYAEPGIIKSYNTKYYVWDPHKLKVIVYNKEGEAETAYAIGVGINDFIL